MEVAERFSVRAQVAQTALVDGVVGRVWVHAGKPRVAFGFAIVDGRIVAIEISADPARQEWHAIGARNPSPGWRPRSALVPGDGPAPRLRAKPRGGASRSPSGHCAWAGEPEPIPPVLALIAATRGLPNAIGRRRRGRGARSASAPRPSGRDQSSVRRSDHPAD